MLQIERIIIDRIYFEVPIELENLMNGFNKLLKIPSGIKSHGKRFIEISYDENEKRIKYVIKDLSNEQSFNYKEDKYMPSELCIRRYGFDGFNLTEVNKS